MRQSFAWWAFSDGDGAAASLLAEAVAVGCLGVEMLPEELWPVARDVGLELVTLTGHDIRVGFNDPANHRVVSDTVRRKIEMAAAGGVANVIVFAGDRTGFDDATAIGHCTDGLAPLAEEAHEGGVTLLIELLNSKVDHIGHQGDHSSFGFEVVRRVDSPGLRVLFDCYHMQLMEGDLSRTIESNLDLIGHIHTAGAPGRHDLDDLQEIHWPAIAGLLHRLDYTGWVGHEFVPRHSLTESLGQAVALFDPERSATT